MTARTLALLLALSATVFLAGCDREPVATEDSEPSKSLPEPPPPPSEKEPEPEADPEPEAKPEEKPAAENGKPAPERIKTESGLEYEILRPGEGAAPVPGDRVTVHYLGHFPDGRKFDASYDRGRPFEFILGAGAVIAGWDEGVALMTPGSKFRFFVPWQLAYGENGSRTIPPKADLVFEVELLSFAKGKPIPKFHKGDPSRQKTTENGIKWEALVEGDGVPVTERNGVKLSYAVWNVSGDLVASTVVQGNHIIGAVKTLQLNPRIETKFLRQVPVVMKAGGAYRFEVPPELCFGKQAVSAKLPGNSVTVWRLEVIDVYDIPAYVEPDPAQQTRLESGLVYEVIREGEGAAPTLRDNVTAHYTGWLPGGELFDSSHGRGEPTEFPLGKVIPGWQEGLQLMKPGAIYRFVIPPKLGYGDRAAGTIPPNSTLIFQVELVKVG